MRRWNGWGDDSISYPLPESAVPRLVEWVGPGQQPSDASLGAVLAQVPPARLPAEPFMNCDPDDRLRHTRGQSLPDWIALRSGRVESFPDGVAYPATTYDVRRILDWAVPHNVVLIPYGGGTSVVGHINPPRSDRPVLTVDLSRLSHLHALDETSQLATFGAGVRGPDLEAQLRASGFTLGHFPQSFEYSTLGGWVVTRSTGQQSLRYGKIERLFVGGQLESPAGSLTMAPSPATAAGPDLREMILGSEGRLGFLTEVTVRISPLQEDSFGALFFRDFASGMAAVRQIVQERIPASMLRLSTAVETATNLALAGHPRLISLLERGLGILGAGEGKCMLMLGASGSSQLVSFVREAATDIARKHGAIHVGRYMGEQWHRTRFTTPYLRNTLWEMGYAIDTLETAASWTKIPGLIDSIEQALRTGLEPHGERVHVFTHLSHLYTDGASIYTSYLYRVQPDPDQTLAYWRTLKQAASEAIVAAGATITHQHGVGTDHLAYLPAEKGNLGIQTLQSIAQLYDPTGIMNPGKLFSMQEVHHV
jgi:alkyldihydroxyacetonephosphate synthase